MDFAWCSGLSHHEDATKLKTVLLYPINHSVDDITCSVKHDPILSLKPELLNALSTPRLHQTPAHLPAHG